jgi:hypothetical protein
MSHAGVIAERLDNAAQGGTVDSRAASPRAPAASFRMSFLGVVASWLPTRARRRPVHAAPSAARLHYRHCRYTAVVPASGESSGLTTLDSRFAGMTKDGGEDEGRRGGRRTAARTKDGGEDEGRRGGRTTVGRTNDGGEDEGRRGGRTTAGMTKDGGEDEGRRGGRRTAGRTKDGGEDEGRRGGRTTVGRTNDSAAIRLHGA